MANKRQLTWANYTIGAMFIGAGIFSLIAMGAPIVVTFEGLVFTLCLGFVGIMMTNRALRQMER